MLPFAKFSSATIMEHDNEHSTDDSLRIHLQSLETRLSCIEAHLSIAPLQGEKQYAPQLSAHIVPPVATKRRDRKRNRRILV
jgi:hypothetical protein